MQIYSDPNREHIDTALPDVEVFWADNEYLSTWGDVSTDEDPDAGAGYYYCFCFPGCLPDSEPYGPFETAEEAIAHAHKETNA